MHEVLVLTLVALLLDCAGLQVQDPACVLGFLRGQLLPDLLHVLGMHVVEDTGAKPFTLRVIEDRGHRV